MHFPVGGAAWENYKLTVSFGGASASDNTTTTAWTIGVVVEWMFAPKWSVKAAYLYMDTDDSDVTLIGKTFTGRAKNNIVRVGELSLLSAAGFRQI